RQSVHERDRYPWYDAEDKAAWRRVLQSLDANLEEWRDYAGWVIAWERLPADERERQKAARGSQFRLAAMEKDPATERQVNWLRKLGWQGEILNKAHASELIDKLQRARGLEAGR